MTLNRRTFLAASGAAVVAGMAGARPAYADVSPDSFDTLIDTTTFNSRDALEANWNYLYPWGSDHNGTARMYCSHTDLSQLYIETAGTLVFKATRISGDEGTSSADPHLPIHYHSAAIHAKKQVLVNDQYPNYEVRGEFQAPSAPGTWPAFWLTGANSWPPESDILEFKGSSTAWFNTYDGSWENTKVSVSSPGSWHGYRAWIAKSGSNDVTIDYYLDDNWVGRHTGSNFVGKTMNLIINLQMEGSSGSSGPSGSTYYRARNVYMGRSNNG